MPYIIHPFQQPVRTKLRPGQVQAFGNWFGPDDDPSQDAANGLTLLTTYFTAASQFTNFPYPDIATFQSYCETLVPGFTANLGELVRLNSASTTLGQAEDRLTALATNNQGNWPSSPAGLNLSQMTGAAGGMGDSVNWQLAIPTVAAQTVAQVASGAVSAVSAVGSGILSAGSTAIALIQYLPYIALGGAALYIFTIAGGPAKLFGKKSNPRRRRR
jgi:hypothetical protein